MGYLTVVIEMEANFFTNFPNRIQIIFCVFVSLAVLVISYIEPK